MINRKICSYLLILFCIFTLFTSVQAQTQKDELFLIAQKAFEDGFYDVAIRYIDQYLNDFPDTEKRVQAGLILGQCYFFKGQYLKAYNIFHELLQYNEFKDATLFWLGETYFKGADYKAAQDNYHQLIEVYPESEYTPQAYYSLAWTYFEQGQFQNAQNTFLLLIRNFPLNPLSEDAKFKIGECAYNLKAYEVAVEYFQNYVLKFPQSTRQAEAYFYVAESYYYLDDFLTAITYYAKAADIAYDKKIGYMAKVSMGWSYLKLGKYELSQRYFDEAQKITQEKNLLTDDIFLGQGTLYSEMEEHEKALQAYQQLIQQFPDSPRIAEAHLGSANNFYSLKKYDDAISEYQGLIDKYSNEHDRQDILEKAYYGLAWTYLKSGKPDLSIKNFETIMNKTESQTVKVSALTQIGDAYQDTENFEKAIEIYDRILEEYPDSMYTDYVQFRQGIVLLKLNKIEAATLSFLSLQKNFPASKYLKDVEYYLGVAYFKKEDWQQAVNHINRYFEGGLSLSSQAFQSEASYILGLSYFQLKKFDQALDIFKALVDKFPDEKAMVRVAELNIANCLYELGQIETALDSLRLLITKYPNSEAAQDALIKLGDHYLQTGDFEQAIAFYNSFLNKFPGSEKTHIIHYEIGQAYEALGAFDKALQSYELIKKSDDEKLYGKAKLAIGDIFSKELDFQTAIQTYENIADSVPAFKRDALVQMANIYANNQAYEKAIKAYEDAIATNKGLGKFDAVELQFSIGDTYEILNNNDKAVESYFKIPYLYSQDTAWIIKAYLRIARIFEDTEKWEEAKLIYNKIVDLNTEESKYALERIDWLKKHVIEQ